MISRLARPAARLAASRPRLHQQQRRTIVDQMNSVESKIDATRAVHNAGGVTQGAANPTYLKQPGDAAVFLGGMGLITFACIKLGGGYWNMAHGTGKLE
mmetsp:Transcript_17306/g.35163  ORF Transcript_17306/g.35163 Transcript_17306/m.35163 type:complete len:99 (+) Transcript_17306:46-342(+)|eukprot:CAMPEP_0197551686 /NCGR_PEP_ID=MMETSP1320-20131121/5233_1 /TAXON_ID=91990 /ORGANISM="Bolidomonas sp., Strain RCC2347" /LENGTH=98 /DNA_ID=CAMNT_0043112217 /DNA_START=9 /DNA_END=305 /DNA_ORIENTATION=-